MQGMLLHPYLSLHLFDLLTDVNIRGLVFGASNALFRQKSSLVDVVVEVGNFCVGCIFCFSFKRRKTKTNLLDNM